MNPTTQDNRELLSSLVEAADTLARIERGLRLILDSMESTSKPLPWWRRMLGGNTSKGESAAASLRSSVEGLQIGLQRLDRALERQGLIAVSAVGQPFDGETMQAIEAVEGTGRPHGTVTEEIRRGYRQNGAVFRFAQVKVAK